MPEQLNHVLFWFSCLIITGTNLGILWLEVRRHKRLKKLDDEFADSIRESRAWLKAHDLRNLKPVEREVIN